ncbi:MAG: PepSY domain-containing protein [Gemmatimonas sp.]
MKRTLALAFGLTLLTAASLFAQPVVMKEEKPGQLKLAKITPDAATATAQAKVPTGKIESAEIESEDGKLIYSFAIKIAGKTGIEEVAVDAKTGKVLSVEHETPADEAKEAKADKLKMQKKTDSLVAARKKAVKPPKSL